MSDKDTIPVRLPSGSKAIVELPRPFTVADATHLIAFLTQYIEDEIHGVAPVDTDLIARLRGEQRLQQDEYGRGLEVLDDAADALEAQQKEIEELRRDAERWRWVVEKLFVDGFCDETTLDIAAPWMNGSFSSVEAFVDAAMKGE